MTRKEAFKYIGIILIYVLKTFWYILLNKKDFIAVKYHTWYIQHALNGDRTVWCRCREFVYQHLDMIKSYNEIAQQRYAKCEWYLREGNDILEYLRYVYENDLIK